MAQNMEAIEAFLEDEVAAYGYDLVAIQWVSEHSRQTLRVFIDFPEGVSGTAGDEPKFIQLADCAKVNRALADLEDLDALVDGAYNLEVSSPGVDRPLRKRRDFERFSGSRVRIRTRELVEGRRRFLGTLVGIEGDDIEVVTESEQKSFVIALADILKANLKPAPAEVFKQDR